MNTHPTLWSDHQVPQSTLAGIAAELAKYYSELSGLDRKEEPFSITRLLRAHAERTAIPGREKEVTTAAALMLGQNWDPQRTWVPLSAIRTMTTTPGAKGGYLVGVDTVTPVDVLTPWSVVASAGATMMHGLVGNIQIPRAPRPIQAPCGLASQRRSARRRHRLAP